MGFSEDMRNSIKYNMGLRHRLNYYQEKAFKPKWDKERKTVLPKIQKHKLLPVKSINLNYLAEMRKRNVRELLVGGAVAAGVFYFLIKYLLEV